MRRRTKLILAIGAAAGEFLVAGAVGLPVPDSLVSGTYVCTTSYATEELVLSPDHKFRQTFNLSDRVVVNEGTWELDGTGLVLRDAYVVDSGTGYLSRTAFSEKCNWGIRPLMTPWGQVRIETNPDLPHDFVKR